MIKLREHTLHKVWEIDDQVIVQMDANYSRVSDGKAMSLPCVDIYTFEGERIKEWRVYPDVSPIYAK